MWIEREYTTQVTIRSTCEVEREKIIRTGYNWEFVKSVGKGSCSLGCKSETEGGKYFN